MTPQGDGWFEAVGVGALRTAYRFRLDASADAPLLCVPDPGSRQQRKGDVHGYSLVSELATFTWKHGAWRGRPWNEAVIYELHVGAMGGFAGVERALPRLAALGVTAVELTPIAEFPGERSWGYDGVCRSLPQPPTGLLTS